MRKKIIAIVVAVALLGVGLFQVVPALADNTNPLDHVQILPAGTTLATGAAVQFTAQGYDASNNAVSNASYTWWVSNGGGTIMQSGIFTAGTVPGTYTNTVQVIAVQGAIAKNASVSVTVTSVTPGALDHVVVTPATRTVAPGTNVQYAAQAYDVANVPIPSQTFVWSVAGNAGTISTTGLFTAGTVEGTYTNAIQATVSGTTKTGTASVVVKVNVPVQPSTAKLDAGKLITMFNGLLGRAQGQFDNFLGGQWQVKNGTAVDTIKAIPGIVQTASATALSILPNGQTAASNFTLPAGTNILPKGTVLATNDKVVVVTVNDQVKLVVKIAPITQSKLPPGLKKQDEGKRDGKMTPPGWSMGHKTGWNDQGENEDD